MSWYARMTMMITPTGYSVEITYSDDQ